MNIKTSSQNTKELLNELTPVKDTSSNFQKIKEVSNENKEDARIKKLVTDVFGIKSKQFIFDCGLTMASLNYIDSSLKFCLMYHFNNTDNFEQFIESVKEFIHPTGYSLSEHDIERLKNDYNFKVTGKVS